MNSPHSVNDHSEQLLEQLTMYALGLLEPQEASYVEAHLSACAACLQELSSLQEAAAELPCSLPDLKPAPQVRERVLRQLGLETRGTVEQPLPGVFVLRKSEQQWRESPYTGVSFKVLHVDRESKNMTSLLRLQPGARYPAHRHAAVEQCLVLQGTVRLGQIELHPGDFEYALAGTVHDGVMSDQGCVLMIISNQQDEVFG